mmetsp:Transcript_4385/g.9889  ORF Transcript_4385/g.9889 Transcript_4385/m.9889 type:complete len:117 (+) Transcript_4385:167-517(+)
MGFGDGAGCSPAVAGGAVSGAAFGGSAGGAEPGGETTIASNDSEEDREEPDWSECSPNQARIALAASCRSSVRSSSRRASTLASSPIQDDGTVREAPLFEDLGRDLTEGCRRDVQS